MIQRDASADDFSLVLGGPLFQLMRRTRLSDDALGLLHRRVAVAVLITWAPLLALSALEGGLLGPRLKTPFLHDIGFHLRFLVVGPLLIAAELVVHRRMRPILRQFQIRGLVPQDQTARFTDALDEAMRSRNSVAAEATLIALVYAVGGLFTLHRYQTLGGDGWWDAPASARLSLAGLWLVFVSLPLIQFLLLRWYFRLFIWARLLWRISRIGLHLDVLHPDKSAGLGFLSDSLAAFIPIATAHGVLFAGMLADRILFSGASLTQFYVEILGGAVFLVLLFAGPLAVFAPRLAHVKRSGLQRYGALGQRYVREFRDKWLRGHPPADEPLVGSGDIQSLADLGNSFASAEQTRIVPIRPKAVIYFLVAYLAPILPLTLTLMSAEKLMQSLVKAVF